MSLCAVGWKGAGQRRSHVGPQDPRGDAAAGGGSGAGGGAPGGGGRGAGDGPLDGVRLGGEVPRRWTGRADGPAGAGRPPQLSGAQLRRLDTLIMGRDPRQVQFAFGLWTREMVRVLIRREFGVGLSVVSVGRLLRSLGLSPQRPLGRAYQQHPEAVPAGKAERFPAIRAEAAAAGATVLV